MNPDMNPIHDKIISISKALCLILFVVACTAHPFISVAADWQETVKQGDELYGKRAGANGKEDIDAAIKKYEEALKGIPKGDEKSLSGVYVKLAQAYFTLGAYFSNGKDELSDLTDEGQRWAKKAKDADPESAEAYYWLGANLGLWRTVNKLSFRGGLTGGGIKKLFKKAAELDPDCEYGLPNMLLADLELSKGKLGEAESNVAKAVVAGPELLKNQLALAKILWNKNDKEEARKTLEHISRQSDDILPSKVLENRRTIAKAKKILEELKKGSEPDWGNAYQ
ncbi:MAG: TRAP transporter TatT component family protein [Candidatus Brocadiales bacterium]|nr:TRAP transporter TatT component family protein [Candidatus Bathyanammoxibius amoris]